MRVVRSTIYLDPVTRSGRATDVLLDVLLPESSVIDEDLVAATVRVVRVPLNVVPGVHNALSSPQVIHKQDTGLCH